MLIANNGDISFYEDTGTTAKFFWDASAESLGIGTVLPGRTLDVQSASGDADVRIYAQGTTSADDAILYLGGAGTTATNRINFGDADDADRGRIIYGHSGDYMSFTTAASEAMRIDSSGNLLVGTTSTNIVASSTATDEGFVYVNGASLTSARSAGQVADFNRITNDGEIIRLRKDGAAVGSIGAGAGGFLTIGSPNGTPVYATFANGSLKPTTSLGSNSDGGGDLGNVSARWKDLYLSGGVYLGGTGAANHLDDYEEGDLAITFTPDTSGSISMNSSYNRAAYTKIGNLVTVTGLGIVSTVSSPVGYVRIPLPFTVASGTDRMNDSAGSCAVHNSNANMRDFLIMTTEGSTDAIIRLGDATTFQDDSGQAFKAGTQVYFSITYRTT